ncbi:MAG: DUF445 domain-containing protein [Rhodospirillales bacterium]|nr:DUF445 domain-containing protein [Rhodospirillales bacterium]MDE2577158.1 DUF445 domain-containing protein [Rhodospirillales bacterium]
MPPPPDPDLAARRSLLAHRAIATGLLLLMAALTVGAYWLPDGTATQILQAAAKAGFVGGIADWFAVTALFRHPLGLPIPHTAIIPAQKARLGRALGRFVATHVFTEADVARTLTQLDLPAILRRFLQDKAATRPAALALAALLPRLLATIEDGRARRVAARLIPRLLGGPDAGRVVGRALQQLVQGGRHQEVFGFILGQLKTLLIARESALQLAIAERVREQGGRLVGWALGASIARRVLGTINAELEKMEPDGSELREAFDEWIHREIARIEHEPARAAEIGAALRQVVAHDTVRAWFWDVWSRLRLVVEQDAARPDGRSVAFLEAALGNLGTLLASDATARARLEQAARGVAASLLPAAQTQLADFIAGVVANWDAATITNRLELRIGPDLQFVRINGTLVGFLVGGLVYAALRATFGHVSF